jgi:nitroreductase
MELETAIRGRRSIRLFKPDEVPEKTITELLELARWAPSWANTQDWRVFAVTGDTLNQIKAAYRERASANAERSFEIARPKSEWPPEMAARTRQLMVTRNLTGAAPSFATANAELFGASWLLLLAIDERLQPEYACFDCGLLVQTLCLAAHAAGLGTCVMAMAVGYPDVLHALVPGAAGMRFVVGVALGVPDASAAINNFARQRAALPELVTFVR